MSTMMMLNNVRLSYPTLFTPKPFADGDTPAWSAAFHLDKVKHADLIKAFEAAEFKEFEAKLNDKQKPKVRELFGKLHKDDRRMHDGDDEGDAEGCMVVKARATLGKQAKPVVLDRRAARVNEGDEGAPYAGCYVNAQVDVWAQTGKYTRTNCTLMGVQFVRDGDAFGGGKPADLSKFADLGDQGGEEEDLSALA
jgi:hypothetical protein